MCVIAVDLLVLTMKGIHFFLHFWLIHSVLLDKNETKLYITGRSTSISNDILKYWAPFHSIPLKRNSPYLLLTGTLQIGSIPPIYWDSGTGRILFHLNLWKMCFYMTNKGTVADNPVDEPLTYSIAILCEIDSISSKIDEVIIYPSCSKSSAKKLPICVDKASVNATLLSIFPYQNLSSNLVSSSFAKQINSLSLNSISRAVCTVQTFQNQLSGPSLHLFVRYYLELNWIVIVFDRFGDHYEHISAFLGDNRFFYFPSTILLEIYPDLYDDQYRAAQVMLTLIIA